jgi:hypothetical protein
VGGRLHPILRQDPHTLFGFATRRGGGGGGLILGKIESSSLCRRLNTFYIIDRDESERERDAHG